jgi:DNA-binding response OmpR family regulator
MCELRREEFTVPIILATSVPEENVAASLAELRMHYLGKPYSDRTLLSTVSRLLNAESG